MNFQSLAVASPLTISPVVLIALTQIQQFTVRLSTTTIKCRATPIRRLVGNKKILPYLIDLIGPSLRLDHQYALLMKSTSPPLDLHGGGTPYCTSEYYHFKDNRFYCGLTVASFALTDVPPDTGGFCCVPGSHKSNLRLPPEFEDVNNPAEWVVHVPVRRGDVVLFPETLTHGSLRWKGKHERRTLLFKYCPGHILWEKGSPFTSLDYEWEEHQKQLLRAPYFRANS
jgi:hypothetical protein